MNEEIEYAEMLEIPISTVNVVKKKRRRLKKAEAEAAPSPAEPPLKDSVIAQVNDRMESEPPRAEPAPQITADADLFAESANSEGYIEFDPIPDRIDTVRLYATDGKRDWQKDGLEEQVYNLRSEYQNEGGRDATNDKDRRSKVWRILLSGEFAVACALCGAIFLTNVFMPNSAINTFFRALNDSTVQAANTDNRTYSDFTLSPVVSELSDATLSLSPAGILSFTDDCCVYPAAEGTVSEVTQSNGVYTVKINHSDSFTGVIYGLSQVYCAVGDEVTSNIPVGYSDGTAEVQVTMYSGGELLNCFRLTEENCLAWTDKS